MISSTVALFAAAMTASAQPPAGDRPLDAASSAPAPVVAPAKPAKKPKDPLDKLVCVDVQVTGSHLGAETVCKRQREWNAMTEHGQKVLEDATRLRSGMKPNGG